MNATVRPLRATARAQLAGPGILLGVVAPFVVYQVATALGTSELTALAWGAVFPLAGIVVGLARRRRLDAISAISLVSIVVGLAGGLLLHSAQFLLVKDSLVTATIGLAFLGSLLAARPLIFVIGRAQSPGKAAVFDARWAEPAFRRAIRRMTAVWGAALLGEAAARVVLSLLDPARGAAAGLAAAHRRVHRTRRAVDVPSPRPHAPGRRPPDRCHHNPRLRRPP